MGYKAKLGGIQHQECQERLYHGLNNKRHNKIQKKVYDLVRCTMKNKQVAMSIPFVEYIFR
jgi:hypothetical protein